MKIAAAERDKAAGLVATLARPARLRSPHPLPLPQEPHSRQMPLPKPRPAPRLMPRLPYPPA